MWWLFQVLIMTLIIGPNGAYPGRATTAALPLDCWQLLPRAGCQFDSTICFNEYAASQTSWILLPK
jgi:hypothetical protein